MNGPDPVSGGEALLERTVRFGRYLRLVGLPVNPAQVIDLLRAVGEVGCGREDFKLAARATLVTRKEDLRLFDRAFDVYWRRSTFEAERADPPDEAGHARDERRQQDEPPLRSPRQGDGAERDGGEELISGGREAGEGEQGDELAPQVVLTYSATETLKRKDFGGFSQEEVEQARRMMENISWRIGERRSRRTVRARKGRYLDLRRSLRLYMKHGEPVELARRTRKTKPRQLVLICDISGSMDRYSRMLLQFLHTVEQGPNPAEVFVFGTRLTRITRQLRTRNVDDAVSRVSKEVQDWAGGTRIGESLRTFNTVWSRRVLRRGAVVLIISDGWDRGEPEDLRREMARLQRSAHRLIWLNPLLGSPTYEPLTRGIQAALPYVDDFLPVHNLDSLESLARTLSTVSNRRPVRRQTLHLPTVHRSDTVSA